MKSDATLFQCHVGCRGGLAVDQYDPEVCGCHIWSVGVFLKWRSSNGKEALFLSSIGAQSAV